MANPFTYDIQQADYDYDQYDRKGAATFQDVVNTFRRFPWRDQVGIASQGAEPTLSVKNSKTGIDLWVSVVGSPQRYDYIVGIVYPKQVKGFFGLGSAKEVRWVTAYTTQSSATVESLFKLYFQGDMPRLTAQMRSLPLFLDQEAR